MEDIYLSKSLKKYYSKDFTSNVLTETDEFWKISDSIRQHLIELNKCLKIQPLYSKFPDNPNSASRDESYLRIAYTKEIELFLFRNTLPGLLNTYKNGRESKISYYFLPPKRNDNYREKEIVFKQGCLCNPDYFKINHVHISFNHWSTTKHQEFWDNLKIKLIELSEYK